MVDEAGQQCETKSRRRLKCRSFIFSMQLFKCFRHQTVAVFNVFEVQCGQIKSGGTHVHQIQRHLGLTLPLSDRFVSPLNRPTHSAQTIEPFLLLQKDQNINSINRIFEYRAKDMQWQIIRQNTSKHLEHLSRLTSQ